MGGLLQLWRGVRPAPYAGLPPGGSLDALKHLFGVDGRVRGAYAAQGIDREAHLAEIAPAMAAHCEVQPRCGSLQRRYAPFEQFGCLLRHFPAAQHVPTFSKWLIIECNLCRAR
jgi:hypothetical protein